MRTSIALLALVAWPARAAPSQNGVVAARPSARAAPYTPTQHGVVAALPSGLYVEIAVEGLSSFRVSLSNGTAPTQMSTLMVAPKASFAPFTVTPSGSAVNLSTAFGSLSLDALSGALSLANADGTVLTQTTVTPSLPARPLRRNDTCDPAVRHSGVDVNDPQRSDGFPDGLKNVDEAGCCAACNSDASCVSWVWSDGTHPDPAGDCWPLKGYSTTKATAGRVLGGFEPPPPPPPPGTTALIFSTSSAAAFYGSGAAMGSAETLTRSSGQASVNNRASWTPSFWNSDGWAMQAVSPYPNTARPGAGGNVYPVAWASSGSTVSVSVEGGSGGSTVDVYLTPAATLVQHVSTQAALQGAAAKLPRYAFGFMACRWGWVNQPYIEGVLSEFRTGSFPVDAFISDFEWFTARPDYTLPSQGDPNYHDFAFNNVTFPGDAGGLIARYRSQYNFRFGGIRKPRLGNSASLVMAAAKGWLMGQGGVPGAQPDGTRNLNYSHANGRTDDMWTWYTTQNAFYLQSGVAFFWNDEGEDDYLTFSEWAAAESAGLAAFDPARRYWSIDRAFSPGAARLGAIVWTGDIQPNWNDLQQTPGMFLNWALSGAPYTTCDIGGFSGETNALLLTRWYGLGVFMPVMRVHSTLGSDPHFPFPELWGAEASAAMRSLLQLRYALLPHIYSLAHLTFTAGLPVARPLVMHFTDAATADLTSQWLIGDGLLVAPVLDDSNSTSVVLPVLSAGVWFEWESVVTHAGGQTLSLPSVPLAAVPAYARSGSIFTLAPPIQFSDALPGGPLNVVVYAGADGAFTLVEDDGETRAYDVSDAVSTLALSWDDAAACLSWVRGGVAGAGGAQAFVQLAVTVYDTRGASKSATPQNIGTTGKACPA